MTSHTRTIFPVIILSIVALVGRVASSSAEDKQIDVPGQFSLSQLKDERRAAKMLDTFLRNIDANHEGVTEIRFPPGVFCTEGSGSVWNRGFNYPVGFRMKSGWHLKGAGMNPAEGTTLKLFSVNEKEKRMIVCSSPHIDERQPDIDISGVLLNNSSIEDLIIDCNYEGITKKQPELKECLIDGIRMYGQNLAVRRVMVRNAASRLGPDNESFIVNLKGVWRDNRPGHCYIGDTIVTNFVGGYTSALHFAGIRSNDELGDVTGMIERCKVYLNGEPNNFGLNCGGQSINVTFRNNEVYNAGRGINNDTWPNFGFKIVENTFKDCRVGIYLRATQHGVCRGNEIHLAKDLEQAAYGIAVGPFRPGAPEAQGSSNWVLENNTIHGNRKTKGRVDIGISLANRPSLIDGIRNERWFWVRGCSLKGNRFVSHGTGTYKYLVNRVKKEGDGATSLEDNVNQDGSDFLPWFE